MKKGYKNLWLGLLCAVVIGFTGCKKDVEEVSPVISVTEICDSDSMKGLTNPVSSEEEFTDLIREVVLEFIGKENFNARAAAKTPSEAVNQINSYVNEFVDSLLKTVENLGDLEEYGPSNLSDLKIDFSFDKAIDIGQLKFSEWIDVISEALEEFSKTVADKVTDSVAETTADVNPDEYEDILEDLPATKEDIKNAIVEELGAETIALLDKYCVIKTVGFGTKIKISLDVGKLMSPKTDDDYLATKIVDLGLNGNLSVGITNFDKLYKEFSESDVSVKGIALNTSGNLELCLSGSDISSWITFISSMGLLSTDVTVTKASLNGNNSIVLAICTSTGKGGYITISADENMDADSIIKFIKLVVTDKIDEDKIEDTIMEFANKVLKISISVSDGSKQTWKKDYSLESFMEFAESIGNFPEM